MKENPRGPVQPRYSCLCGRLRCCPRAGEMRAEPRACAALAMTHPPHGAGQVLTGLAWSAPMPPMPWPRSSSGEDFPVSGLHVAPLSFQPGFFHCSTPSWVLLPVAWMAHRLPQLFSEHTGMSNGFSAFSLALNAPWVRRKCLLTHWLWPPGPDA